MNKNLKKIIAREGLIIISILSIYWLSEGLFRLGVSSSVTDTGVRIWWDSLPDLPPTLSFWRNANKNIYILCLSFVSTHQIYHLGN